jgi:hypothetical protein
MWVRFFALLLLLASIPPAFADDVHLTNGRKFEGVIAETTDSQVRIRMAGGILSLPLSQVAKVEKAESSLGEYLRRKEDLQGNSRVRASDWLELSRWAQSQGLPHGARESALRAAELDPRLDGLAPVLRGLGYVYDEQIDRWIPYAESMRRRGFVLSYGQWITRQEYEAAARAREDEAERRRIARQEQVRAAREDRLAALTELVLVREVAESERETRGYRAPLVVFPGYFFPPVFVPPGHGSGRPRHGRPSSAIDPNDGSPHSNIRVPGSLIPGRIVSSPGRGH